MTTTEATTTAATATDPLVIFDMYRDVHKGIRAELFAVTGTAGSVDPGDRLARVALADHVSSVADFLAFHAHHEDVAVEPAIAGVSPELAERIAGEHVELDARIARIADMASSAVDAPAGDHRRILHWTYLDLAAFVSSYLAHQDLEERVVMPALEQALGVEAVVAIHDSIIQSIPPAEMASSLATMLPAMNLDDRVDLLAGMRAGAPPEAFAGVVTLARSVLSPCDNVALVDRLGL